MPRIAPFTAAARRRSQALLFVCALARAWFPGPVSAQASGAPYRTEQVSYRNAQDSTYLPAVLTLPRGRGPHPGVVLLSIAGADPLIDRLVGLGYMVLRPERRGFVAVEPLLQATYYDLAQDALAGLDYLRSRPEVDARALSLIGQADDAPAAMLASVASLDSIPLILVAPPGFPGREVFRLEQHGLAQRRGDRPQALDALDRLVDQISSIVLSESSAYLRSYRLGALMAASDVRLPYNAAFPDDEGQIHFFSSPLWHDRLAFDPEQLLARLHAPVLVLIGMDDPDTPLDAYMAAVRRGLARSQSQDATRCASYRIGPGTRSRRRP
ncbi:MAG: hypothetical protein HY701_08375 [Gemmatimonadetes bacterium]|nr:hypothetical protein [Gemmatimonadota bacterium]